MSLYRMQGETFTLWDGEPINGNRHPLNIETAWTDDDLAAIGLYRAVEPTVPAGHFVTKRTETLVDGRLVISIETAPIDPPQSQLRPLTARQLRLGLLKIGIRPSDVTTTIEALPAEQRDAAEIEWNFASEYRRDHQLISTIGASFGLTEAQIDAAWLTAMEL